MSKYQRRKGHDFERWTVNQFKKFYPDAERNLNDIVDGNGVDVTAGPFAIQCKAYKNYAPIAKIEEVKDKTRFPVLVTKGDNKKPKIVMDLELFLKIIDDVGVAYSYDPPPF